MYTVIISLIVELVACRAILQISTVVVGIHNKKCIDVAYFTSFLTVSANGFGLKCTKYIF